MFALLCAACVLAGVLADWSGRIAAGAENAGGLPTMIVGSDNYPPYNYEDADGKLTVVCGEKTEGTLQNQLNNSTVKIQVEDEKGNLLSGAKLVLKKQETGEVVPVNQKAVFESTGKALVLENNLIKENSPKYNNRSTAESIRCTHRIQPPERMHRKAVTLITPHFMQMQSGRRKSVM